MQLITTFLLVKKTHLIIVEIINNQILKFGDVIEETQLLQVILGDQASYIVFNIIQCLENLIIIKFP